MVWKKSSVRRWSNECLASSGGYTDVQALFGGLTKVQHIVVVWQKFGHQLVVQLKYDVWLGGSLASGGGPTKV